MIKIVQNWLKTYQLHVLIWLIFIFYESVVVGLVFGIFGNPVTYAAHYLIIITLFYLHADFVLPWILAKKGKQYLRFPIAFFLEIITFVLLSFLIDLILIRVHLLLNTSHLELDLKYNLRTIYREIYFLFFSTGYFYLRTYNNEKRKTDELEKQRLNQIIDQQKVEQELTKAQNAFLKAQINPHFLFNTLDFVYHNILSLSPVSADAIITLADMMRYAIDSDKMGDYIRLGDELEQVENFLSLTQLRKSRHVILKINYTEDVKEVHLIPLVLLTLVENIFKHGNVDKPEEAASVEVYLLNSFLVIETNNSVDKTVRPPGHQTGLANIHNRLSHAYGDSFVFQYEFNDLNRFKVLLKIPITSTKERNGSSLPLKNIDKELPHEFSDQF